MTATMTGLYYVITGDIPLNPTNPFDKAQGRRKLNDHKDRVRRLVERGHVIVRDSQTAAPLRGTYQRITWLMPPQGRR